MLYLLVVLLPIFFQVLIAVIFNFQIKKITRDNGSFIKITLLYILVSSICQIGLIYLYPILLGREYVSYTAGAALIIPTLISIAALIIGIVYFAIATAFKRK